MRRLSAAVLLCVTVTSSALAADPEQSGTDLNEQVVVTATRIPAPSADVAAGVTVIDQATIQALGATNLTDVLSAVPGVHIVQTGGPGGQSSVFMRGANSNQVLVLRDGMPLNDASDPSAAFNFGVDLLGDLERIEVVRGPMGSVYGSGAIGGVINLISKRGVDGPPTWTGTLSGGYPPGGTNYATLSGGTDGFDYAATIESEQFQGQDYTPKRMTYYTGTPQGFGAQILTLNVGYRPIDAVRLGAFVQLRNVVYGFDNLGYPNFDQANSTGYNQQFLGRLTASATLFDGLWDTSWALGRQQQVRRYEQSLNPNDPNLATNDSRYFDYETDAQWNNTLHLATRLPPALRLTTLDATFGAEWTYNQITAKPNSTSDGFTYTGYTHAQSNDLGLYLGLSASWLSVLHVQAQVRQDWISNVAPVTTWRLGVVYDVTRNTRIHVAYGTAFLVPSLNDRYGADDTGFVGNPNLRPESSRGWETGVSQTLPGLGRADFVTLSGTYFASRVTNLIQLQFAPVEMPINVASANLSGVESEITIRPADWLTANLAYTYTSAADATGTELPRRPQNTLAATLTLRPVPRLAITTQILYTGPFSDYLTNNQGFSTNVGFSPPGTLVNVTINYTVNSRMTLFAHIANVTNSRFEPANGYMTPGTWFLAGLRFHV
jgi:vitamin B12 transporter